jgi:hypothetical protein
MLSLAYQPCAMAMDMDPDHLCPHCPAKAGQGHHRKAQLNEVDDCDFAGIYSHDSRTAQSKVKDTLDNLPALVGSTLSLDVPRFVVDAYIRIASPRVTHSSGPPLNILYCTYLK